jgi:hypothetical protein
MTYVMLPNVRALPIALALAASVCGLSTTAFAQSTPASATTQPAPPTVADTNPDPMRLTDEQRDAILNANTEARAAAARGELSDSESLGRRIHGEMGVMIGSNGTRGIYGTADIPLGENAGATVSFESSRFGYPRSRLTPR